MPRPTLLTAERQQRIVQLLGGGAHYAPICAEVGISATTWANWRSRGAAALQQLEADGPMADSYEARQELDQRKGQGKRPTQALERRAHLWDSWRERPYLEFLWAIQRAEALPELDSIMRVRDIGRGGQLVARTTRTTVRPDGTTTTTVEERYSQPQWAALMAYLERRWPVRWRRQVELVPTSGEQEEDPLHRLVAELGEMRQERRAALLALPGGKAT